jgi:hypothetical protein
MVKLLWRLFPRTLVKVETTGYADGYLQATMDAIEYFRNAAQEDMQEFEHIIATQKGMVQ